MPRIASGVCRKIDYYPWYEWTQKLEWQDDEFEDKKQLIKQQLREQDERERNDDLHEMY